MRYVFTLLLAVVLCSCSPSPKPVAAMSGISNPGNPVITRIATRHQMIVVRSGASGPTYSVETSTGEVLVGEMTLDQLALKNPELFRQVKSLQVGMLWAGTE